jgi:sarcosine oxidase/L-pipecolate oxidase
MRGDNWALTRKLVKMVVELELPIQPLEIAVCYWRIKEGNEEKYAIGGDFLTFACYGDPYVYSMPSLEYPGLIKMAVHRGIRVTRTIGHGGQEYWHWGL